MTSGAHHRVATIALVLAAAAAIAATALPMCSSHVLTESASVSTGIVTASAEFRRVHCGLSAYQVMLAWLPVVVSGIAVALRTTAAAGIARFVAAAMLVGFVIIAGFSIGLLYAPAAAAMMVAARIGLTERRAQSAPALE